MNWLRRQHQALLHREASGRLSHNTRRCLRGRPLERNAAGSIVGQRVLWRADWTAAFAQRIQNNEGPFRVGHCRPRTSAVRSLDLGVSFLAVRPGARPSLADPEEGYVTGIPWLQSSRSGANESIGPLTSRSMSSFGVFECAAIATAAVFIFSGLNEPAGHASHLARPLVGPPTADRRVRCGGSELLAFNCGLG
jgi:hypothetical protein